MLEAKVQERTQELESAQIEIIERLARAAEFRDDNTGQHTERVGQMAALLAQEIGMPDGEMALIRRAAPLHDVGKIGIPDAVLLKLGKLTDAEFALVKTHTDDRREDSVRQPILPAQAGRGDRVQPSRALGRQRIRGLVGEAIPLAGRIVAVADVFDALTQKRPYKAAWPVGDAVAEIERQRGRQFDPALVDAFLRVVVAPASRWRARAEP